MTSLFDTIGTQSPLDFPTPLAVKHAPKRVAEFLCERPRRIMSAFVQNPRPDAFYFLGPSGLGKTEMALAMAREIPAELHHMPSKECTLETVKAACERCQFVPRLADTWTAARLHLVLVDEAHTMSPAAREAFLSKLDSTARPPNTVFVFTGNAKPNDEHGAFMSRVKLIEFSNYGLAKEIVKTLERIWLIETGGQMKAPNFARIAKDCNNNIRDAINSLELELMAAEPLSATPMPALVHSGAQLVAA